MTILVFLSIFKDLVLQTECGIPADLMNKIHSQDYILFSTSSCHLVGYFVCSVIIFFLLFLG